MYTAAHLQSTNNTVQFVSCRLGRLGEMCLPAGRLSTSQGIASRRRRARVGACCVCRKVADLHVRPHAHARAHLPEKRVMRNLHEHRTEKLNFLTKRRGNNLLPITRFRVSPLARRQCRVQVFQVCGCVQVFRCPFPHGIPFLYEEPTRTTKDKRESQYQSLKIKICKAVEY